jgi:hypothetical protein
MIYLSLAGETFLKTGYKDQKKLLFRVSEDENLNIYNYMLKILTVLLLSTLIKLPYLAGEPAILKMNSRFSFYSFEKYGEMLLYIPQELTGKELIINMNIGGNDTGSWKGVPDKGMLRLGFPIDLSPGTYNFNAGITVKNPDGTVKKYTASANLVILAFKHNEAKLDRLTGGMVVNRKQFFPFGFFCYAPVHPSLPEEEIVKGFNMISPYQMILPGTMDERKDYMDRCARIGMKVHYNLLSVAGGGGVNSNAEGMTEERKRELLVKEIVTFRDHPALLAWYIADEPNGYKIPPDYLKEIYTTITELDPWHPVSVVIMAPFLQGARKYADAFDFVMADPYPLPDLPGTIVGNVAAQLSKEFSGRKPVWIAPQAFGGGELWRREPTIQELRSMTYQAVINGATGIQYFVRQGPNYFPKSVAAWGECGKMAVEFAELTPWLLSDEEPLKVTSFNENIIVTSRLHNNRLMIMAVNLKNMPVKAGFLIHRPLNGKAGIIFENRSVTVKDGLFSDFISALGSQVYMIDLETGINKKYSSPKNLVTDPGFEDMSTPGIPSACYARPGSDRGATYFLDTREYYEGSHSLRITTPENNKGLYLRFFPVQVNAGKSYIVSVWAKADPGQRYGKIPTDHSSPGKREHMPQFAEVSVGGFSTARFVPDSSWKKFITFVTIPADTVPKLKTNIILRMPGSGVAWFDMLEMIEDPLQAEVKADKD